MSLAVTGSETHPSTSFATAAQLSDAPTGQLAAGELAFIDETAIVTTVTPFPAVAVNATATLVTFTPNPLVNGEVIRINGTNYLVSAVAATTASLTNLGNPGAQTTGTVSGPVTSPATYYRLAPTSTQAVAPPAVLATAESEAGVLPGRWIATSIA